MSKQTSKARQVSCMAVTSLDLAPTLGANAQQKAHVHGKKRRHKSRTPETDNEAYVKEHIGGKAHVYVFV